MRFLIFTLFLTTSFSNISQATPLSPETRLRMEALRSSIQTWAPMCNGAMALDRKCYQFDMIEYAGWRCVTGDLERCNDIKEAQDTDGRFWRAKGLIGQTKANSFSRDMFMGLMMYFTKTKDVDSLNRWMDYLSNHRNKMCDDAKDNRCSLMPSTWGMLGIARQYLGLKQNWKMKIGRQILPGEMVITAKTAPLGFELELLSDNIIFLRSLGIDTSWIRNSADILNRRQPNNPVFKFLSEGSTEELAQLISDACPAEPSAQADDIFFQRRLERNADGVLVIVRDWGEPTPIPVKQMADGHDCIISLNLLLNKPFENTSSFDF